MAKKRQPQGRRAERNSRTPDRSAIGKRSRNKGARGEREAAERLATLFGWQAKRAQQHSGTETTADVLVSDTPGLWFEVKRVNRLNVPKAMAIATDQSGRKCPVLMHRIDQGEWLLTINLVDLPRIVHAYECANSDAMAPSQVPSATPRCGSDSEATGGSAWHLPAGKRTGTDTTVQGSGTLNVRNAARRMGARTAR
jgi:hypothetical protein